MRRRISVACSRFLRPGANSSQSSWPKYVSCALAGQDQPVELERAKVGDDLVSLPMNGRHLALQDADIRVLREDAADRSGDLGGTEARRRHLVQQRLKQMMVPTIDERDLDLGAGAKFFGRIQTAESAADDQDPLHGVEWYRKGGVFSHSSVVSHAVGILLRAALARRTFSRISSAFAVHMNDFGHAL